MKKLSFSVFFIFLALPLFAWVFLQETQQRDMDRLLPKILSGREIRVCIDVLERSLDRESRRYGTRLYTGEDRAALYAMSADIVYNAYSRWFGQTGNFVRSAGRKKEFKDVLGALPSSLNFRFINIGPSAGANAYKSCESYPFDAVDLRVRATLFSQGSGGHAVQTGRASFTFELKPDNTGLTPPSGVTSVLGRSSLAIALHEAGHTLGLGDLYTGENAKNSGIYSLAQFYDPISISSVMNRSEDLTCADADGLINLMDFYASSASERSKEGWLSLCPQYGNILYAKGLPVKLSPPEVQQQQEFVKQGRKGPNPLAGQINRARRQAEQYAQNRDEELRLQQQSRQEVADSLRQAMEHTAAVERPAHRKKICALCEREIEPWDVTILKYPDGSRLYVHDACNAKRKAGAEIPAANRQKYAVKAP